MGNTLKRHPFSGLVHSNHHTQNKSCLGAQYTCNLLPFPLYTSTMYPAKAFSLQLLRSEGKRTKKKKDKEAGTGNNTELSYIGSTTSICWRCAACLGPKRPSKHCRSVFLRPLFANLVDPGCCTPGNAAVRSAFSSSCSQNHYWP